MASSAPNQYATELITVMTVVATVAVEKAAVMALAMEVEATVVVVTEVEATMAVEEVVMMAVMAAMVESTVMVAVAAMASAEMGVEKAAMAAAVRGVEKAVRGVEKALGRSVLEVRSRRRSCCFRQNRFDALCWCDYKVHELPHQIREGVSQTQCAARLTTSRQPRRRLEREEGRRPPCHQQPRVPA